MQVAENLKDRNVNLSPVQKNALKKLKKDNFTKWFKDGYDEKEYDEFKTDINALVPTNFSDDTKYQPTFFALWNEAEEIKRELSKIPEDPSKKQAAAADGGELNSIIKDNYKFDFRNDQWNIEVTLDEMEGVIRKDIYETFEKAINLCIGKDSKTGKPQIKHFIDRVILAGSSSHLRLIREDLPDKLGKLIKKWDATLPAPFKPDKNNVIFDPKDAKLAVARGACLPRYFKKVQVEPRDPDIQHKLREGTTYLDFDTKNLFNYIPFNLVYNSTLVN